jgi:amino acid adenylation domain-containing protein
MSSDAQMSAFANTARFHLSALLADAAARKGDHPAVEDERGRQINYAELLYGAECVASSLTRFGVRHGDRVGLWLPKSLESVTAIHGILRAGASYVPVDPTGPAGRAAGILSTSAVKGVVVARELVGPLRGAWPADHPLPPLFVVENEKDGSVDVGAKASDIKSFTEGEVSWAEIAANPAPAPATGPFAPDDLAYILFTSGSTGQPKGVMLSHANAFTFLEWCQQALGPWEEGDRFSSHAPFHFDLSVFDLFVACQNAATLVLIGETLGKDPVRLGDFLAERSINVWYSAPSILSLLAEHGGIDRPGFRAPRLVLFAGEAFPIVPLSRLRAAWPSAAMWNLYGPTETNVCTAFRIPERFLDDQTEPFPIGSVCPPLLARAVDEHGREVSGSARGELQIAGPGVMRGYFGQPELTAAAFAVDGDGTRWYRTGDLVTDLGGGCFQFHGRRDRMVKKRGYRIELGEIETALYQYDGVDRAGVVAQSHESGVTIAAFVALKPDRKRSIIAMKRHCTDYLPNYMIPDTITFLDRMPATSTDKVDYQRLSTMAAEKGPRS